MWYEMLRVIQLSMPIGLRILLLLLWSKPPPKLRFGGQLSPFLPTLNTSVRLLLFFLGISKSDGFCQWLWRRRLPFLNLPRGKETLCVFNLNFVFMTF